MEGETMGEAQQCWWLKTESDGEPMPIGEPVKDWLKVNGYDGWRWDEFNRALRFTVKIRLTYSAMKAIYGGVDKKRRQRYRALNRSLRNSAHPKRRKHGRQEATR